MVILDLDNNKIYVNLITNSSKEMDFGPMIQDEIYTTSYSVDIDENPIGLNGLGNAYYEGIICEKNYNQAFEFYERAINYGNIDALNNAGICCEFGLGTDKNKSKALEFYKKAMEKQHGEGMAIMPF